MSANSTPPTCGPRFDDASTSDADRKDRPGPARCSATYGHSDDPGTETFYQRASATSRRLAGLVYEETVGYFSGHDGVTWHANIDLGEVPGRRRTQRLLRDPSALHWRANGDLRGACTCRPRRGRPGSWPGRASSKAKAQPSSGRSAAFSPRPTPAPDSWSRYPAPTWEGTAEAATAATPPARVAPVVSSNHCGGDAVPIAARDG